MAASPIKDYTERDFLTRYALPSDNARILNAGSASLRYGSTCTNVDIQAKPDVDVVCDLHDLPLADGSFDVVVCNAALQYCRSPERAAMEFHRVLRDGGHVFVDAPWLQPYCPDTPDRFRFSQDGLRAVFAAFEIVTVGPSIRPGSAFAMIGVDLVASISGNRYLSFLLRLAASVIFYPLRWIRTGEPDRLAGANYLIGRKNVGPGPRPRPS